MQDVATQLREFMVKHGLSQEQLARKAHVSQSTVSRILRREAFERHSKARHRLFTYARINESVLIQPTEDGIKRVVKTFKQIWDGSDAHAVAVANVIGALAGLRPIAKLRKGRKHEGHRESTQTTPKKNRAE